MGMFDDIQSEYPLPDVGIVPLDKQSFQTKSLDCLLQRYVITSNGRLFLEGEDTDFHGDILFYGEVEINNECHSKRYLARFTEGQLVRIVFIDDLARSWG